MDINLEDLNLTVKWNLPLYKQLLHSHFSTQIFAILKQLKQQKSPAWNSIMFERLAKGVPKAAKEQFDQ